MVVTWSARGEREEARKAALNPKGNILSHIPSSVWNGGLLVLVVLFGCANNISKQIAAHTLERFGYILGLVSATSYVVLYWAILAVLYLANAIEQPHLQFQWVWTGWGSIRGIASASARPGVKLYLAAAMGDAVGDVIGYLCTPYVSGPVHSLLAQCTTIFTALLSLHFLNKRYSFVQIAALVTVLSATTIGILPNLSRQGANSSDPVMAAILAGSCAFNAFAFVMKEVGFVGYKKWASAHQGEDELPPGHPGPSLNIFVANTAESSLQLPITLFLVFPLAVATGQTHGDSLPDYLREGLACLAGSCEHATLCTAVYVFFNICWNVAILLSVKKNGALATFVALKAIMPTSAVLFAYVDWPLLGRTPLSAITWVSLSVVLPAIVAFTWASQQQVAREAVGEATCCWPLHVAPDESDSAEELSGDEGSCAAVDGRRRLNSG